MATTRTKGRIALALAAAATLAAGAVAATADEDESTRPPDSDRTMVEEVEPAAAAALSVLERERDSGDELPAGLADGIAARSLYEVNPDLSRRAIANTAESLYLLPGDGHVCRVLTHAVGAALGCDATAAIAAGQATPGTVVLDSGDIAIHGIVPDGVETVTIVTGVDDTDAVEVGSNAYLAVVEGGTPLRHVSYSGPSGAVQLPIVDPTDS